MRISASRVGFRLNIEMVDIGDLRGTRKYKGLARLRRTRCGTNSGSIARLSGRFGMTMSEEEAEAARGGRQREREKRHRKAVGKS